MKFIESQKRVGYILVKNIILKFNKKKKCSVN